MLKILCNNKDYTDYILSVSSSIAFSDNTIIGNVVSKQFTLEVDNSTKVFDSILNDEFVIYDGDKKLGVFKAYEKPEKMTNNLELQLYDNVVLTNIAYNSVLAYPSTIKEQLDEMSSFIGVVIDYKNVPSSVLSFSTNWWDNTLSIREHLMYIAELSACNCFADTAGNIIFVPLSKDKKYDLPETEGVQEFTTIEQFTITMVRYDNGIGTVFEYGNETGSTYYLDTDNSYIENQSQIDVIGKNICGLSITTMEGLVAPEIVGATVGDIIKYYDDENTYYFMLMSLDTEYYNAEYNVINADGKLETKAVETVTNRSSPNTKIKKVETRLDNDEGIIEIISKEVDGNKESIGSLQVGLENIKSEVSNAVKDIYKFESGSNNIFSNCHQQLMKTLEDKTSKSVNDMPLDINKEELRNKYICISVNIYVENGIINQLNSRIGVEFDIGYTDGTKKKYSLYWYLGQYDLQYLLQTSTVDHDERIWICHKLEDKEVSSVSNLKMAIEMNADKAMIYNPKVEFGERPTGFEYDLAYVRDNITTIQENYTQINQTVNNLSLTATSQEKEITTIKGNVTEAFTRIEQTEISLQPKNIVLAVNEQLNKGDEISTTSFTLDNKGAHIKNGALDITNNSGTKVFYSDLNGNLTVIGNITGSTIKGSVIDGSTYKFSNNDGSNIKMSSYGMQLYGPSGSGYLGLKLGQGFILGSSPIEYGSNESSVDWYGLFGDAVNNFKVDPVASTPQLTFTVVGSENWGVNCWKSDITLKTNIKKSSISGLSLINAIEHKNFDWIASGINQECGYIAQQLKEIKEDFVTPIEQPNGSYLYQVNETTLIPVITKAIQELSVKIDNLQMQIGGLYGINY